MNSQSVSNIPVRVSRIWDETPEVKCFELVPLGEGLPVFRPGAHIDVVPLPGLVRQYSLFNGPEQTTSYFIGVKRELDSRGGSLAMHALKEGVEIEISEPKNNFDLIDDRAPALFIAGGIGSTPLLSMARHRQAAGLAAEFHIFARDRELTPFQNEIRSLGGVSHHGMLPPKLNRTLGALLAAQSISAHLYICGPSLFMDLVVQIASALGWEDDHLHLERFSIEVLDLDLEGDAFEVVLAQSNATFTVKSDQTIIEALEEAGYNHLTSCEQGVCGTCYTTVLEGEPDHRDQYLTAEEKSSGTIIMPCVSRCKGKRLVLDI